MSSQNQSDLFIFLSYQSVSIVRIIFFIIHLKNESVQKGAVLKCYSKPLYFQQFVSILIASWLYCKLGGKDLILVRRPRLCCPSCLGTAVVGWAGHMLLSAGGCRAEMLAVYWLQWIAAGPAVARTRRKKPIHVKVICQGGI